MHHKYTRITNTANQNTEDCPRPRGPTGRFGVHVIPVKQTEKDRDMRDVFEAEVVDQAPALIVESTGEMIPMLAGDHPTDEQVAQWAGVVEDAVQRMTSVDDLNKAEAALAALEKRFKQLGQNAARIQRLKILALKRIGELSGPAQYGNPRPETGRGSKSECSDFVPPKTQAEKDRVWQARKIAENWPVVAPVVEEMKNPSVNSVLREIKRRTARIEVPPGGGDAVISHASWDEWLPEQERCDILLTDPPYSTDVDDVHDFASQWLPVALDKVKPTGRAYVCIGAYPDELAAYLAVPVPEHMRMAQVLVWTYRNTLGPTPKYDYFLNWQAILYYRGVDADPFDIPEMLEQCAVLDLPHPARSSDRWHRWQKPDELAARFIRHATKPGDVLLDPFAGSGTHLVAAAKLGRRGYGCEIDQDTVDMCVQRGCRNES